MIAWTTGRSVCSCIPRPCVSRCTVSPVLRPVRLTLAPRRAAVLLGCTVGLASALERATATRRDAITRRVAAARWFAIASAAASTVQADIFCVEELSSSYTCFICLDGLVLQRACFAPSYSSANAVADKMYVVIPDVAETYGLTCRRKDGQRTGESVTLLWTCRRSTFFSWRLHCNLVGPGPSESEGGVYDSSGAHLEYGFG
jgi:hypothetical protein